MPRSQIPLAHEMGFYFMNDIPVSSGINTVPSYPAFLNGYFETGPGAITDANTRKIAYCKRPGMFPILTSGFPNNHKIQGMISSMDRTKLIIYSTNGAVNLTWFWNGSTLTNMGSAPAAAGSWVLLSPVVFTILDGISYGAGNYYCATDFFKGAVISAAGVWTEITAATFTGLTKATNFCALDGYLFIGTTNNRIYNCDLNTPTSWQATSFLNAADTPGSLLWLARIRNYLIAFKDKSIEFFEDLGNPTPGSPLEPRKQFNRTIGCINRSTIREMSDGIIFAGVSDNNAPKMYKILKDSLQIQEISTRYIEQCMANNYSTVYSVDAVADNLFKGQSQSFSYAGKEFYIINAKDPSLSGTTNPSSLVYDNQLGVWTIWNTNFGGTGNDSMGFAATQAQMLFTTTSGTSAIGAVFAVNSYSSAGTPPKIIVLDPLIARSSGSSAFTDGGNNFTFAWNSPPIDFGNRKRKFMDSLEIIYESSNSPFDLPNFSSSYTINLFIMDYPYQTGGLGAYWINRTLKIDPGGALRAIAKQLGSFRKRAFYIYQQADMGLKIWAIEIDMNEGETDGGDA